LPPYGTPIPAYGTAAPGGYRAGRRPGVVTTAAVMAFVIGGVIILINLFVLFDLLDHLRIRHSTAEEDLEIVWGVFAVVRLALGALFIWGGITVLKGCTRTVLLVVSVIETIFSLFLVALLSIFVWFLALAEFLELIFVGTVLMLILQPSSRDFFRARGRTTN
jgi:hypothetical protein